MQYREKIHISRGRQGHVGRRVRSGTTFTFQARASTPELEALRNRCDIDAHRRPKQGEFYALGLFTPHREWGPPRTLPPVAANTVARAGGIVRWNLGLYCRDRFGGRLGEDRGQGRGGETVRVSVTQVPPIVVSPPSPP